MRRVPLVLCVLGSIAAAWAGCWYLGGLAEHLSIAEPTPAQRTEAAIPVVLAAAKRMALPISFATIGTIQPIASIAVTSQVSGIGALVALWLAGMDLSVIAVIGIVMLIGIVKKNGIMMIDYALKRQQTGAPAHEAIREACLRRFRPIMMTTFAAILGALPIALGFGAGSELRRPLGVAIAGGLVLSQLLTLYITPVVFLALERLKTRLTCLAPRRSARALAAKVARLWR